MAAAGRHYSFLRWESVCCFVADGLLHFFSHSGLLDTFIILDSFKFAERRSCWIDRIKRIVQFVMNDFPFDYPMLYRLF